MGTRKRRRWPKGTYMRLISPERLRAFVGPEPDKKISGRKLALRIGKHPSMIDHLLSGRCTSCKQSTAEEISEVLGVPLEILFDPKVPTSTSHVTKSKATAA